MGQPSSTMRQKQVQPMPSLLWCCSAPGEGVLSTIPHCSTQISRVGENLTDITKQGEDEQQGWEIPNVL